jgi:hypothetical protein
VIFDFQEFKANLTEALSFGQSGHGYLVPTVAGIAALGSVASDALLFTGGTLRVVANVAKAGTGKLFTRKDKREAIAENRAKNNGELRSDQSGELLVPSKQSQKGVTPPHNEAQVDHIIPVSHGGGRSPENRQVLGRRENAVKSNRMPDQKE